MATVHSNLMIFFCPFSGIQLAYQWSLPLLSEVSTTAQLSWTSKSVVSFPWLLCVSPLYTTLLLTHRGWNELAGILWRAFLNAFCWMKSIDLFKIDAGVPGVSSEKTFLCSHPSLCLSTWGVVCLALMYVVQCYMVRKLGPWLPPPFTDCAVTIVLWSAGSVGSNRRMTHQWTNCMPS